MGKEAKWVVRLDGTERQELETVLARPRAATERVLRARVLLKADEGERGPAWPDTAIADAFEISVSKVQPLRQRLVEEGLAAALVRHPSPQRRPRKLDGAQEARLVTLTCSAPPAGRARWTRQLLADQLVVLQVVDTINEETVRGTLKTMPSSPGVSARGGFLPSRTQHSSARWKMCSRSTSGPTIRPARSCASMKRPSNW